MLFDLRDVLKSLRRTPGYSVTTVVTLALTIGATTAVFSIVNGVLLKPLAYRESHRLVSVREVWKEVTQYGSAFEVNEQHFEYMRTHAQTFESMAQYIALPANLTGGAAATQIVAVRTSGSIFDVLQVQAAIGRTLTPDDERVDRPKAAAITDSCWRQRFGGDPSIVGKPIVLDGMTHTVVGVLPPGFQLPSDARLTDKLDAFVPIRMAEERVGWYGDHNNQAIGRLKKDVTIEQARAELDVLQRQVSAIATKEAHEPVTLSSRVTLLTETIVGSARRGLLLLLGAIAAVLLIACSNLANLALTRTLARQREAAIRAALGASRTRLVTRAVFEELVLSLVGGTLGLLVAWTALGVFVRTAPVDLPRMNEVAIDPVVLLFAGLVSIVAGVLVAVIPASHLASRAVQAGLRVGGTAFTGGDRGATRTRSMLLALQVGVAVMLLVVTALLSVSFVRLVDVDRGFDARGVLAVGVAMPADRYAEERVLLAAYDRVIASLGALPGVRSVTTTTMIPLGGEGQVNFVAVEGDTRPRAALPSANFRFVAPDFFKTLGIVVVRGRSFADRERDPKQPAPAVISQNAAARLWPGQDPIGKRFSRGQGPDEQGFEVVGIVTDAKTTSLETTPPLMVYAPYWWRSRPAMTLLLKTAADPASVMPAVRRAVREIDPDIAIGDARPLERIVEAAFAPRRYQMRLFLTFGLVALVIAIVGVYGTTAYGVSRRRREMNIRVALGARRSQVMSMIVRQAGSPIASGLFGGVLGAIGVGGIVATLLFDVRPRDPAIIAGVVAIVGLVGLTSCVMAARQGLVINPAAALREE